MNIDLIVPSRGRPQRLRDMVASALETADNPKRVHVRLGLDRDDPEFNGYLLEFPSSRLTVHVNEAPGTSVPALMNWLASESSSELLMAASDDIIFRTRGWDAVVERAFAAVPDRLLVAYTNDGRDRDKCEHFFVSSQWVRVVGYFMRSEFRHFSADEWVDDIARRVGRSLYLRDVVTEHMHAKYGKAPNDETYRAKRRHAWTDQDRLDYIRFAGERIAAAERVAVAMVK